VIFSAASLLCLLIAFFFSKKNSGGAKTEAAFFLLLLLPALSLFINEGPPGFALIAILLFLFQAVSEPCKHFFITLRLKKYRNIFPLLGRFFQKKLFARKKPIVIGGVLFFAVCVAGGVNFFRVLAGLFFFCLSMSAAFSMQSFGGNGAHIRFVPLPIKGEKKNRLQKYGVALPFSFSAFAALLIPLFIGARAIPLDSGEKRNLPSVGIADYRAHLEFQKNFAYRRLVVKGGGAKCRKRRTVYELYGGQRRFYTDTIRMAR